MTEFGAGAGPGTAPATIGASSVTPAPPDQVVTAEPAIRPARRAGDAAAQSERARQAAQGSRATQSTQLAGSPGMAAMAGPSGLLDEANRAIVEALQRDG